MMKKITFLYTLLLAASLGSNAVFAVEDPAGIKPLQVKKCQDFKVSGAGDHSEWNKAEWNTLIKLDKGGEENKTKFKIMYSGKGIYLLFDGEDSRITTRFANDFENLWEGDVFEVFFHPDPEIPVYLEYEVNQLDKELLLIIPNLKGKFRGWIPWNYSEGRRVEKKVKVSGGKMAMGSVITSWSAELFFPYDLFNPLPNVPPVSGTIWNANFYRLDYDTGKMIKWAWSPVNSSFHEFKNYRPIRFE